MDRYIGLGAHTPSCTVAVVGRSGRRLQSQVLETTAKALISFLRTNPIGGAVWSTFQDGLRLAPYRLADWGNALASGAFVSRVD